MTTSQSPANLTSNELRAAIRQYGMVAEVPEGPIVDYGEELHRRHPELHSLRYAIQEVRNAESDAYEREHGAPRLRQLRDPDSPVVACLKEVYRRSIETLTKDGLYAEWTIDELADRRRAALARGDDVSAALRDRVISLIDGGMSEHEAARRAGVDRMTVRSWLGKR
jgi:hypothetical protein